MEFQFETTYDSKTATAMARAVRKTVRKKKNRRTRIFGWILMVLIVLLNLPTEEAPFVFDLRTIVNILLFLALLAVLLFEDRLNGYFVRKRMLPGMQNAVCTFRDDLYQSATELGTTQWNYENISMLAETPDYFVFLFGANHAQAYSKSTLTGGTPDEFRTFLKEKTGKEITFVK